MNKQLHMKASPEAVAAVIAAKNYERWGAFAATRFAAKHAVPVSLFCMALGFEEKRRAA